MSAAYFLELTAVIFSGIFVGVITGLIPGLHVNLVSAIVLFYSPAFFFTVGLEKLAVFIFAVAVTHTIFYFIPTIFLGASDNENNISHLPGHRLLLKGKAKRAVMLCISGCLISAVLIIFLSAPLFSLTSFLYGKIRGLVAVLLMLISALFIIGENTIRKKILAFVIFIVSGVFGVIVLNLNMGNPLLAMLSGLFGVSALLSSLNSSPVIPRQSGDKFNIENSKLVRISLAGIASSALVSILPSLSASHATHLGAKTTQLKNYSKNPDEEDENFLILTGSVSMAVTLMAVVTAVAIHKARNGAVVAMEKLAVLNFDFVVLLIFSLLIVLGFSVLCVILLSRIFLNIISRIDYMKLCLSIIFMLFSIIFYFDGLMGIIVLFTATAIGTLALLFRVKRNTTMACLIVPVIFYFL